MGDSDGDIQEQKITLALLGQKIDTVLIRLDRLTAVYDHDHDAVTEHTQILSDCTRRIGGLESQQVARTWETRIVEILLSIATAVGLIKAS